MNVFIEYNNFFTRWPCLVCGGRTEKENAHPMVHFAGEDGFLCDQCLARGADGIKLELVALAADLKERAKALRQLAVESWTVPTMAELLAFCEKVDGCYSGDGGFTEAEMARDDAIPF